MREATTNALTSFAIFSFDFKSNRPTINLQIDIRKLIPTRMSRLHDSTIHAISAGEELEFVKIDSRNF